MSKIEWTDETWNPITGCSVVSPGCTNCYAMRQAGTRLKNMPQYEGLTLLDAKKPVWNGKLRFNESALDKPSGWRKPRRIFVNSMGDLFHENVPHDILDKIWMVMALNRHHTFQILTKRPELARAYLGRGQPEVVSDIYTVAHGTKECPWPLPNVWLGVSVENQMMAERRIPLLLDTPAAIRWISAEPLLGNLYLEASEVPVDTTGDGESDDCETMNLLALGLDWVVTGGESGPDARPMNPIWALSLRDQCVRNGVAFNFKQWGEWVPAPAIDPHVKPSREYTFDSGWPRMFRVGKKAAGRLLDGVLHDGFPDDEGCPECGGTVELETGGESYSGQGLRVWYCTQCEWTSH